LKEEGGVFDRRAPRLSLRSLLVVTQLALAMIVLIGAGLCIKSLRNLLAIDPGYQTESVLIGAAGTRPEKVQRGAWSRPAAADN